MTILRGGSRCPEKDYKAADLIPGKLHVRNRDALYKKEDRILWHVELSTKLYNKKTNVTDLVF